jgi:hypothetical protein
MLNFIKKSFLLFFGISLFLSACDNLIVDIEVIEDAEFLESLYQKAKDTLIGNNQRYSLKSELYRDFFPGVIPEKSYLIASFYFGETDSLSIDRNLAISKLYVANGQQIWISSPMIKDQTLDFQLHGTSTKGPLWETDIKVDVFLEIIDLNTNQSHYLINNAVNIDRIE